MPDQKTGLVVTAHPGDFVWRAGGAIALHAKRGYRMKIVCMSYGERGESQFAWKEAGATLASVKAGRKDEAERAAKILGAEIEFFDAGSSREIDNAFANLMQKRPDALLVSPQGLLINRRVQVVTQATRHALPTIANDRNGVVVGQLLSYAPNSDDLYRLAGVYAGRILKGEKPADLPVIQPMKFELVVNLKTAKALGLPIPETFLARADEVIE